MDRKILVLDNSTMVAELLDSQAFRQASGWKFVLESDPSLFVDSALSEQADLILLSNQDVTSGYQCTETLRKEPATESTPLLLLTSARDILDESLLAKLGVSGFIRKPFEFRTLKAQVSELLAQSSDSAVEELDQLELVDDELIDLLSNQQESEDETLQVQGVESVDMDALSEELDPTQHWVEAIPLDSPPMEPSVAPTGLMKPGLGWSDEPIDAGSSSEDVPAVEADLQSDDLDFDDIVEDDLEMPSTATTQDDLHDQDDDSMDLDYGDDEEIDLELGDEDPEFSFEELDDELLDFEEEVDSVEEPVAQKTKPGLMELKVEVRLDPSTVSGSTNQRARISETGLTVLECVPFGGVASDEPVPQEIEEIDQIALDMDFLDTNEEGELGHELQDSSLDLTDDDDLDLYPTDDETDDSHEHGEFDDEFEEDWEEEVEPVDTFADPLGAEVDPELGVHFDDTEEHEDASKNPPFESPDSSLDFNGDLDEEFDLDEPVEVSAFEEMDDIEDLPVDIESPDIQEIEEFEDPDESFGLGEEQDEFDSGCFDGALSDEGEFGGDEPEFSDPEALFEPGATSDSDLDSGLELEDQGDFGEPEDLLEDESDVELEEIDGLGLEDQGDFGEPEDLYEDEEEPLEAQGAELEFNDPSLLEATDSFADVEEPTFETPQETAFSEPEGVEALEAELESEEAETALQSSLDFEGTQELDHQVESGEEITFVSQESAQDEGLDPLVAQEPLSLEIEFEQLPPLGEEEPTEPLEYAEDESLFEQEVEIEEAEASLSEEDEDELSQWLGDGVDDAAGNLQQMINLRQVTSAKFEIDESADDLDEEELDEDDLSVEEDLDLSEAEEELEEPVLPELEGDEAPLPLMGDASDSEDIPGGAEDLMSVSYTVEASDDPVSQNPLGSNQVGYQTVPSQANEDDAELKEFDDNAEVLFEVSEDVFGMQDFNMEAVGLDESEPAVAEEASSEPVVDESVEEGAPVPVVDESVEESAPDAVSLSTDPFDVLSAQTAADDEVKEPVLEAAPVSTDPFDVLVSQQSAEPASEANDLEPVHSDADLNDTQFMSNPEDFESFLDDSVTLGDDHFPGELTEPAVEAASDVGVEVTEEAGELAGFDPELMSEGETTESPVADEVAGFDPALMAEDDLGESVDDEVAGFDPALMAEDDLGESVDDEVAGFDPALMAEDESEKSGAEAVVQTAPDSQLNVSEDFQDKLGGMIEQMVQETIQQTLDDLLPQMMQQIVKEELEND